MSFIQIEQKTFNNYTIYEIGTGRQGEYSETETPSAIKCFRKKYAIYVPRNNLSFDSVKINTFFLFTTVWFDCTLLVLQQACY